MLGIMALILIAPVKADVGIGIVPADSIDVSASSSLFGDKTIQRSIIIYNPGDRELQVTMSVKGDIAPYVEFQPQSFTVAPEPKPLQRTPVNGQIVNIIIHVPNAVFQDRIYTGALEAIGAAQIGATMATAPVLGTDLSLSVIGINVIPILISIVILIIGAIVLVLAFKRKLALKVRKK
jgi:hypothetical protein